jgi:hypothetical protein
LSCTFADNEYTRRDWILSRFGQIWDTWFHLSWLVSQAAKTGETALTLDLGLATNSLKLLNSSAEQFVGESGHILDEEKNIYRHVNQDWGYPFWATGNGWMMYGIMRVVNSTHLSPAALTSARFHQRRRQTGRTQERSCVFPFHQDRPNIQGTVRRDQREYTQRQNLTVRTSRYYPTTCLTPLPMVSPPHI